MLAKLANKARLKVAATLLATASLFPSSSNETSAAQRGRAETASSQTTSPRAGTAPILPSKDRQGPELPFKEITIFLIPRELPREFSNVVQYLHYQRDMYNEDPRYVFDVFEERPQRRDIIMTGRIRYAGPSPGEVLEAEGRVPLEMLDPKTGRIGEGHAERIQLSWNSLAIIEGQEKKWREWQEQADQQKEKMQDPFTRDTWTLGGKSQEGVRFITTTVNGKFVRLQRISDGRDSWFETDTLHPDEAKLISDFYREQAKKAFAATGGLQLAVVMLPQVQQELSERLDGAALESQPGDSAQPQTVEELLQEKLPEDVVVATTLVTDNLGEIASHLQEVFDGSRQENDQPLYPVTISDPRELRILKAHFEKLLESLRQAQEEASLSMLELPPPPGNWAEEGSIAT